MNGLNLDLSVSLKGKVSKTGELANLNDRIDIAALFKFIFGTGAANKADLMFHDRRVLVASADETLDLTNSSLLDAFGDALVFDILRAIIVVNSSDIVTAAQTVATDATITIGNAVVNPLVFLDAAASTFTLAVGDVFVLTRNTAAGITVGAGSADEIKVVNNDGADQAQYDIILVGEAS